MSTMADVRNDPRFVNLDGSSYGFGAVSVAVIDTGIDMNHPGFGPDGNGDGLSDRIVAARNFAGAANGTTDATDSGIHGTHVAGIVGSTKYGVAPDVNIVVLKASANGNNFDTTDIQQALDWVITYGHQYNIVAVNLSLGNGAFNTQEGATYASSQFATLVNQKNISVVVAAGNDFLDGGSKAGISSPASDPNAISVGNTTSSESGFHESSQRSPGILDIAAPGYGIKSTVPGDTYGSLTGTSMSAPYISGLLALGQQLAIDLSSDYKLVDSVVAPDKLVPVSTIEGWLEQTAATFYDAATAANYKRADPLAFFDFIYNHFLTFTEGSDVKDASEGNDTLFALGGNDTVTLDYGDDFVDGGTGADWLYGDAGDDTLDGGDDLDIDHLYGDGGNDIFQARPGDIVFDHDGSSGVFVQMASSGPSAAAVTIDLGLGNDTVDVTGEVNVDADLGSGFDNYFGGDGDDHVVLHVGGSTAQEFDRVSLGNGNDSVTLSMGSSPGSGTDIFEGGDGYDVFNGGLVELFVLDLATGIPSEPSGYEIIGFEEVNFTGRTTVMSWGAPTFSASKITTSDQADTVLLAHDGDYDTVSAGDGSDFVDADSDPGEERSLVSSVNRIIDLGSGNDVYEAGAVSQGTHQYQGGEGEDTLDLRRLLSGNFRDGNGSYFFNSLDVVLDTDKGSLVADFDYWTSGGPSGSYAFAAAIGGFETYFINGSLRSFEFIGSATEARDLRIDGTASGHIGVTFGSGDDRLAFLDVPGSSDSTIAVSAGAGTDTLDLAGADFEFDGFVDNQSGTAGGWFDDGYGLKRVSYDMTGFEIFRLGNNSSSIFDFEANYLFTGSDDIGETVEGGNNDDDFRGNGGADTLKGGAGDDTLSGGAGGDTLDGGTGKDALDGGADSDIYIVDRNSDVVIEAIDGGTADHVKASASYDLLEGVHVELLSTTDDKGTKAINLYGNEVAQEITGNAGRNIISDGGKGAADVLKGLGGNDTYKIYNTGTVVVEGAG
ncbi:MAG: S8 family serine peptidase, partial [Rhizobiaceae bacterium]|nr:S8 family serine peptidase [Rhizobiaceae bacterium]